MNSIVVGLCCVLGIGVASAAANSGVVMIADADVSTQGAAHFPADVGAQVQSNSNVRTQADAGTSAGITLTASAARNLPPASATLNRAFAVSYARTKPSRIPPPISPPTCA